MHKLMVDKDTGNGQPRTVERAPLNLNLLTFYLIVLLVPFQYILDILGGSSSTESLPNVLEATFLAIVFTCLRKDQPRKIWGLLAIAWFVSCGIGIMYLTITRGLLPRFSIADAENALVLLGGSLLIRALWHSSPQFHTFLALLGPTLFPWLFMRTSVDLMEQAIHHLPYVYDPVLFRMDEILALGWVSRFADILRQHAGLAHAILFNYYHIALWGLLAAISQCLYTPPNRAYLLFSSFILGTFGFCLYYLMPAVAPFYFFGPLFPDHLPSPQTLPLHSVLSPIASFRNTMPSLHTASALLMFLALRASPLWHRMIGAVVVLCIMVSTLALGEHYAVDLIAAFPLVLLARGLSAIYLPASLPARRNAVLAGGALIALWVFAVRCGPISLELPGFIPLLAGLSLAAPILLERRLAKAEHSDTVQSLPALAPAMIAQTGA